MVARAVSLAAGSLPTLELPRLIWDICEKEAPERRISPLIPSSDGGISGGGDGGSGNDIPRDVGRYPKLKISRFVFA